MRGHVRKKDSSWQYTIELGRDPMTGKRKQKSKQGFKTKKECEAEMAKMIAKIDNGEYTEYEKMTLALFLNKWLDDRKKNLKITTIDYYKHIFEKQLIPELGFIELQKLKPIHIQEFLNKCYKNKNINNTTIKHYFTALKTALHQAVKWQLINSNPCDAIEQPKKVKKEMKVLSLDQAKVVLNYVKNIQFKEMYIPILLSLTCGLRRGEIIALRWNNVFLDEGYMLIKENASVRINHKNIVTTPKTEAGWRTVTIPNLMINILKEHKKCQLILFSDLSKDEKVNSGLVCCWPDGRELTPNYLTQSFKKYLNIVIYHISDFMICAILMLLCYYLQA